MPNKNYKITTNNTTYKQNRENIEMTLSGYKEKNPDIGRYLNLQNWDHLKHIVRSIGYKDYEQFNPQKSRAITLLKIFALESNYELIFDCKDNFVNGVIEGLISKMTLDRTEVSIDTTGEKILEARIRFPE